MSEKKKHHSFRVKLPIARCTGQYQLGADYDVERVLKYLQSFEQDARMYVDIVEIAQDEYEYRIRGYPFENVSTTYAWGQVYLDITIDRVVITYDIYSSGFTFILISLVYFAGAFIVNLVFNFSLWWIIVLGIITWIFTVLNVASCHFFLLRSIPRHFEREL